VIQTDPRSSFGYAGLAEVYAVMPGYDTKLVSDRIAMKRAWSYARQALALDAKSSEAHAAIGYLQHAAAKQGLAGRGELERAIALDPSNASAHLWLGSMLSMNGFARQARGEFETAERLEPASPVTESWLASSLFLSRDYGAALERLHRALDLDPSRDDALKQLGIVEAQRGELAPALEAFARLAKICRCAGYPAILRAYAYAKSHRTAEAHAQIAAALQQNEKKHDMSVDVAFVYVALGERDHALTWLRRMGRDLHGEAASLALDPRFDPVRGDARFSPWTRSGSTST
jgi:Flp pilus assembly protein TadD